MKNASITTNVKNVLMMLISIMIYYTSIFYIVNDEDNAMLIIYLVPRSACI